MPVAWVTVLAIQLGKVVVAPAVAASGDSFWLMVVSVVNAKLFATGFAWMLGETTMLEVMFSLLTQIWPEARGVPAAVNGIRVSVAVPLSLSVALGVPAALGTGCPLRL